MNRLRIPRANKNVNPYKDPGRTGAPSPDPRNQPPVPGMQMHDDRQFLVPGIPHHNRRPRNN